MRRALLHRKSFSSSERGVATLELAVVLPILLTMGLGALEFGNLIYQNHLVSNGVRDAARYLSGLPYDASNTTQTTANETAAKNIVIYGATSTGATRLSGWVPGDFTVAFGYPTISNTVTSCGSARCYRGGDAITTVTVSATVPYTSLGFLGYLGFGSYNLSSSHKERLFGVR